MRNLMLLAALSAFFAATLALAYHPDPLAVVYGGSGTTTSTGTAGSIVLSIGPTLTGSVGIGAAALLRPFQVSESGNAVIAVQDTANAGGGGGVYGYDSASVLDAELNLGRAAGLSSLGDVSLENETASGLLRLGTNATERLRIDAAGNVGIGLTSTNAGRLSVAAAGSGAARMILQDTSTGAGAGYNIIANDSTAARVGTLNFGEAFGAENTGDVGINNTTAAGRFVISTGNSGTAQAVVDSAGNVGIGATTLSAGRLTIAAAGSGAARMILQDTSTGAGAGYNIIANDSAGTRVGTLNFGEAFGAENTGDVGINNVTAGGSFIVSTGNSGTTQFKVDSSGNVFVPNTTTGTNADFLCMAASGQILRQTTSCTISQRQHKEKITPLESGLSIVLKLKPVQFNRKDDQTRDPHGRFQKNPDVNMTKTQLGFVAEEVEEVDHRLAVYEQDGKTPLSYRAESVIAALVKAVQEQQAEILELKKHAR